MTDLDALTDRLQAEMRDEAARDAPPPGFPAFPDIPKGRYVDADFWQLEQEHLWPNTWVLAGRAEDLPEPGAYRRFDDLGVPLVLVRDSGGGLTGYFNTCQHRGAPVVRNESGWARTLRCQYHSWTYDIDDGALVAVPDERDFVELDRDLRCLPSIRVEEFDGWVFVNQDPDAVSLLDWLGAVAGELAQFQGADLRCIDVKSETVPCNWKVTAEAFLEVYHFRHIHSHDGFVLLDNRAATMGLFANGHSRMVTPLSAQACARFGMDDWTDWRRIEPPGFADIPTVCDMVRSTSTAYSIFPNFVAPVASYGFPVLSFWPLDIGTTRVDWIHYAPVDWDGDEPPAHWQDWLARFDVVMAEDFANMAPIQRSLQSPAIDGIPINYQERRIWHFHEELDRVIGPDRVPAALRVPPLLADYVEA